MARKHNKASRRKASRHATSVKLHELTKLIQPKSLEAEHIRSAKVRYDLPVHIGGTYANIDPKNPDGLTPMQRECVREASSLQHMRAAAGVGDHTTVTIQEHFGWLVRRRAGDNDPKTEPDCLTRQTDERTQTDAYARRLAATKDEAALARHLKARALRENSEALKRRIWEAELMNHVEPHA